tara:strand:+ start:8144 stop:9394 length:1251 start_codon:yes stop_codon:yes gene_type:complete
MDTLDIVLLVVLVIVVIINCCHKLYNYNNDYVFEPSQPKSTPSGALDQLIAGRDDPMPMPSEPVKPIFPKNHKDLINIKYKPEAYHKLIKDGDYDDDEFNKDLKDIKNTKLKNSIIKFRANLKKHIIHSLKGLRGISSKKEYKHTFCNEEGKQYSKQSKQDLENIMDILSDLDDNDEDKIQIYHAAIHNYHSFLNMSLSDKCDPYADTIGIGESEARQKIKNKDYKGFIVKKEITKKMLYEDYDMDRILPTIDSPEQAQYYRGANEDDILMPAPVFNLNSKIFNTLEQFKKMYELSHDDSEPQGFISGQTQNNGDNSVTLHMVWADWCGYSQKAKQEWPKVKEMVGDMHKNVKVKFEDILEKDNKDRIKKEFSDLNGFPNHFIKGMINGKKVNTKFNGVEANDIVKKLIDVIEKHL